MLALDSVPSEYQVSVIHSAFAVVASFVANSFEALADDSNCSSHFDSLTAIVDDVVGMLTLLSSVIMDLPQQCVAFVVPLDGMTKRNPCLVFALHQLAQLTAASPFAQELVMLIPMLLVVVLRPHFSKLVVAFALVVDLVRCLANVHVVIMDYSIVAASVWLVTLHSSVVIFVDVEISDEISVTFVAKLAGMALDTVNSMELLQKGK